MIHNFVGRSPCKPHQHAVAHLRSLGEDAGERIPLYPGISRYIPDPFFCSRAEVGTHYLEVSPARAGMDRFPRIRPISSSGFPRTRGDGPRSQSYGDAMEAFPPHARGGPVPHWSCPGFVDTSPFAGPITRRSPGAGSTSTSYAEAARLVRLAAEHGVAWAQAFLGEMYERGFGVPQDNVSAHMWFNLAAAQATGEQREQIAERRDKIAETMTREDISEAQRRAREWSPE